VPEVNDLFSGGAGKRVALEDLFKAAKEAAATLAEPDPSTREEVPLSMRLAVGSARPDDQLATVRQHFPDAQPSEKGSFTFTSPRTGRPTYFNPPGLDLGDLAAGGRMAAEAVGGTVGGTLGAIAGAPAGPGGLMAGGLAGAGLGNLAAGTLVDAARSYFGSPQSQDYEHVAKNAVSDIAQGAVGELGGQALAQGLRLGARALVRPGAEETVRQAAQAGVPVTARMTMRGPLANLETTAAQVLPYSQAQRTANRLHDTAQRSIGGLEPPVPNPPATVAEAAGQAGASLKAGANRAYDSWRGSRLALDNQFYGAMAGAPPVQLPSVQAAAARVAADVQRSPGVLGEALRPVQGWLDRINADLAQHGGALPIDTLRQLRTQLGGELETSATTDLSGPVQTRLRDIYAAINTDMRAAAAAHSPQAASLLGRHDAMVRAFRGEDIGREGVADALDSVLKAGSDEQAWNAFNAPSGGALRMQRLVGALSPAEHDVVARAVFERMTTTPAGNEVTPTAWATKWLATPAATKQALFGGRRGTDIGRMDALAQVLRRQAEGVEGTNTSRTAYELQRQNMLGNLAKLAGGLAGGGGAGLDQPHVHTLTVPGATAHHHTLTPPRLFLGAWKRTA
jgi:hypothetical protein